MNTAAALRQYAEEYRTILLAMELLLDAPAAAVANYELATRLLLGADVFAAFVHVTERLQQQVARQQLQVDLVVATLLHEGCNKLGALSARFAAGTGHADEVMREAAVLRQCADVLFARACRDLWGGSSS